MKKQILSGIVLVSLMFLALATVALLPLAVQGQALVPPQPIQGLPGTQNSRITLELAYFISLALAIVGILAVGFIIYGGFRYITSAGNEELAKAGKDAIRNCIIGLVIIILSYIIITVIINALAFNRV